MTPQSSDTQDLIEKVIEIPDFYLMDLSSDGKEAAVISSETGSYQLFSISTETTETTQLSTGEDRVIYAAFSPDSQRVAFSRDFEGREQHQLFTVPVSGGGEAQIGTLASIRVFDFTWSPMKSEIAFAGATREANGLWLMDTESGDHSMVYRGKHWVFGPEWTHDGSKICVTARTTDHPTASEIVFIDPRTAELDVYTPKEGSENVSPKWSPDDASVLFKTDSGGTYELAIYQLGENGISHLQAGKLGLAVEYPFFGWMPDGERVWYLAAKDGRTKLYLETLDGGRPEQMPLEKGYHTNLKVAESGHFAVYSWSALSRPATLSKYDFAPNSTTVLRETHSPIPLGRAERASYETFDRRTIHGFMVKPPQEGGPRPCVLWIHGGPAWEVADEWNPAIQAFAVTGYNLFAPNIRGSTGYGVEFQNLNIKDLGGDDLKDVAEARKYLQTRRDVESEKVAIVGASYGGFMTFLAMTKLPQLWAAGVAIVGITDWKEMYELSDAAFRSFIEKYMGIPEGNQELYNDRSAINFVDRIAAPILIWHRGNDSRCPLRPVERFVEKLKNLGKTHEFRVVWDEGHGPQKTRNLARQYKAAVAFLDQVLRG